MRRLLLLSGCLYLFAVGCHKRFNPCDEATGIERSSSLGIAIFNTVTNDYMYPRNEFQPVFTRDSFQVINEDGRKFNFVHFALEQDPRDPLKGYYTVGIAPAFIIPDDNDAFNQEKTRKICLKYNYNTSDTLTLVFKAFKDDCGNGQYEYLKIYYKGSLIASVTNDINISFTLNR